MTIVRKDVVWLNYNNGESNMVGSDFVGESDQGIDQVFYDWLLADVDFSLDHQEFKRWRDTMIDIMICNMIDFWEAWQEVGCNATGLGNFWREQGDGLSVKHDRIRANIETRAVRIVL